MQAKITKRLVEGLQPKAKKYDVRDTELPGFLLRVQPTGAKAWYLDYRNAAGQRLMIAQGDAARFLAHCPQ